MSHDTDLECEVFLDAHFSTREQLAEWLGTLHGYSAIGFEVKSAVLEIEVRKNPRLKGLDSAEVQRFRANKEKAFIYSELLLEVCPKSEKIDKQQFVAEMRKLTAELIRSGFSVHVATDLDVDFLK